MRMMLEYPLQSATHVRRRGRSHFDIYDVPNCSFVEEPSVPFPVPLTSPSSINGLDTRKQSRDITSAVATGNSSDDDAASHSDRLSRHAQFRQLACADGCRCRCHRRYQRSVRPIPNSLSSWLGTLTFPGTISSSFWLASDECNEWACRRKGTNLRTIEYLLPTWFAQVEASIRFEALPVHVLIQTPRVVESLDFLLDISLDDFKQRLSTRSLTIHDTQPNGQSVVHVRLVRLRLAYEG